MFFTLVDVIFSSRLQTHMGIWGKKDCRLLVLKPVYLVSCHGKSNIKICGGRDTEINS